MGMLRELCAVEKEGFHAIAVIGTAPQSSAGNFESKYKAEVLNILKERGFRFFWNKVCTFAHDRKKTRVIIQKMRISSPVLTVGFIFIGLGSRQCKYAHRCVSTIPQPVFIDHKGCKYPPAPMESWKSSAF